MQGLAHQQPIQSLAGVYPRVLGVDLRFLVGRVSKRGDRIVAQPLELFFKLFAFKTGSNQILESGDAPSAKK